MSRFTTLAVLAIFMLGAALMTGCDSGSNRSSQKDAKPAPPTENTKPTDGATVPAPGK